MKLFPKKLSPSLRGVPVSVGIRRISLPTVMLALTLITMPFGVAGAEDPTPGNPPRLTLGKPFACADYGGGKICLVDKDGKITWRYPAVGPQDVWVLSNGNILFSHVKGALEVTRDRRVVGEIFDFTQFGTISGVFLLDVKGDPAKYEIER